MNLTEEIKVLNEIEHEKLEIRTLFDAIRSLENTVKDLLSRVIVLERLVLKKET